MSMPQNDRLLKKFINSRGYVTCIDVVTADSIPVRFVLFDKKDNFQRAIHTRHKDVIGCYFPGESDVHIGLICLCLDYIGAGIFTHEIYHLAEYLDSLGWESEKIAETLQDVAGKFWSWYYKIFENKQ